MTKDFLRCVLALISILSIAGVSFAKVPEVVLSKKKAVVTLYIEQNKKIIASGSGFIVTDNGIIVTNNHVIEPWNKTKESLLYIKNSDGTFLTPLELIASDATKDVAILKVKENNLPFILLSDTPPKEGEDVVVIGSPLGLETTITSGIISSIRGEDEFLQISAPVSAGSSGSPVMNANGEAIGMATLLMKGGQNLNFAIPTSYIIAPLKNMSKEKMADLESRGILEKMKEEAPAPAPVIEASNSEVSPNNAEMYFLRAKNRLIQLPLLGFEDTPENLQQTEYNKVECQSAFDELNQAILLNNNSDKYYAARGALLTNTIQCTYNYLENAMNDYEAAIRLNSKEVEYLIKKGRIHQQLHQLPKLLECAKEVVRLSPNKEDGYYLYGKYYEERHEYDKALEYVKKGLRFYKKGFTFTSGTYLIDSIMNTYKKYDEAIKLYSDLIKKFPNNSSFYGNRGKYYSLSKNYKNAITDFTTAIDLAPKSNYYYSFRANAYRANGNFNAALSDYNYACDSGDFTSCNDIKAVRADIRRGPNWVIAGASNNSDFYFDKSTLVKNKNGSITVWVKGEISNKEDFIAEQELAPFEKNKYNNASHTLNQYSFDCKGKQLNSLNYLVYSENGNILYSYANEETKLKAAIPDSIGSGILDKACKFSASTKTSKK